MYRIKFILFAIFCLYPFFSAFSQEKTAISITGRVLSYAEKSPIPYANIFFKNAKKGTQSNVDGGFKLNIPENTNLNDTIIFSFIGYEKKKITLKQLKKNNIVLLNKRNITLSDVVIKEYKTVDSIMAEVLRRIPENYITDTFIDNLYFRDWRTINDSLFYFAECLLNIYNTGYTSKQCYYKNDSVSNFSLNVLDTDIIKTFDYPIRKLGLFQAYYQPQVFYFNPIPYISEYKFGNLKKKRKEMTFSKFYDDNGHCYYKIESIEEGKRKCKDLWELIINKEDFAIVDITNKRISPKEMVFLNSLSEMLYKKHGTGIAPEQLLSAITHAHYTKVGNKYRLTYIKDNLKTKKITKKEFVDLGASDTIITEYTKDVKFVDKNTFVPTDTNKIPLLSPNEIIHDKRFYIKTAYNPLWKKNIVVPELDANIKQLLLQYGIVY